MITNVRIQGSYTNEALWLFCRQFGEVVSIKTSARHEEEVGVAFVCMASREQAFAMLFALKSLGVPANLCKTPGQLLKLFQSYSDTAATNVYFAHLPAFWKEGDLAAVLPSECVIESIRVLRKQDSPSNRQPPSMRGPTVGVAFCRMKTRLQAVRAIQAIDGMTIQGHTSPIQARFADSPVQNLIRTKGWGSAAALHKARATTRSLPPPPEFAPFVAASPTFIDQGYSSSEFSAEGAHGHDGSEAEEEDDSLGDLPQRFTRAASIANMDRQTKQKLVEYMARDRRASMA